MSILQTPRKIFLTAAAGALFAFAPAHAQLIELERADGSLLCDEPIPLDATQSLSIDPFTGDLKGFVDPAFPCATGSDDVQVSFDAADSALFTVNGQASATVPDSGSVLIDWFARGAWICEATGLEGTPWPGSGRLPSGSEIVPLSALTPGTYTAGMVCSNGNGNTATADPVEITITESGLTIPNACRGRQPGLAEPSSLCEAADSFGNYEPTNCFQYSEVFGRSFPGIVGQGVDILQQRDTYFAMEFSTEGLTQSRGSWTFETPQVGTTASGPKFLSISQCPGDFDPDAIEAEMGPNCYVRTGGFTTSVLWKQQGTSGARCALEPNTTYYLNMMFSTDPVGTPPGQLEWECQDQVGGDACANNMAPSASN
jgi:hypothetical protein